jgi:hypothetical protein
VLFRGPLRKLRHCLVRPLCNGAQRDCLTGVAVRETTVLAVLVDHSRTIVGSVYFLLTVDTVLRVRRHVQRVRHDLSERATHFPCLLRSRSVCSLSMWITLRLQDDPCKLIPCEPDHKNSS